MKYENQYYCKVTSKTLRKFLSKLAKEKGFKEAHYNSAINDSSKEAFLLNDNSNFGFGFTTMKNCEPWQKLVTFEEMVEIIETYKEKPVFTLNNDYKAEKQPNGDIKVGCQTFSANVIESFIKWYQKN